MPKRYRRQKTQSNKKALSARQLTKGNRIDFADNGKGNFDSPAGFRGKPGRTYSLTIAYDVQTYHSDPETLRPVPPIDTVYSASRQSFTKCTKLSGEFLVYLDVDDPAGEENYYQWDWIHYSQAQFCAVPNIQGQLFRIECCTRCWNMDGEAARVGAGQDGEVFS